MLVTIGITCFNAQDTIERAMDCALAQSWPNCEIVVVDDCSTDRSAEIIERLIAGRNTVRLIRHPVNSGPGAARNSILAAARGEFVVFFDDDDESRPERVETQIRRLEIYEQSSGAQLVVCVASGLRRYPNGYALDLPAIGSRGRAPHGPEFADYLLFFRRRADWDYGGAVPACAVLARRSTFETAGGFDPSLRRVEDHDFAIRLALAGGHFTGTSEQLYTQFSTDAPDKSPEQNLEAEQAIVKKHQAYLKGKRRYYYALHWPKLRYWHFKHRPGMLAIEFFGIFIHNPLASLRHFLETGSRRVVHEWRMRRKAAT